MSPLRVLAPAVAAALVALTPHDAGAQAYPNRPIQVIIPFAGGSASDVLTRILLEHAGKTIGQPFVIENRPGAGGNTGTQVAARAAPDGYTLVGSGSGPMAANVTLYKDLGYDPAKDFEPIGMIAVFPIIIVTSTKLPVNTLSEMIAYAKARPGELNYASLGPGSSGHLATVLFAHVTGLKLQHVPYPTGFSQAVTDIMSGRISLWLSTLGGALGNVQSGKVRAIAVSGTARAEALPEVPTFKEAGVAMEEESTWFALFAPKGTPKDVIAKVNRDVEKILTLPDVKERAVTLGYRFAGGSPERLGAFLKAEIAKWSEVAKDADLTAR